MAAVASSAPGSNFGLNPRVEACRVGSTPATMTPAADGPTVRCREAPRAPIDQPPRRGAAARPAHRRLRLARGHLRLHPDRRSEARPARRRAARRARVRPARGRDRRQPGPPPDAARPAARGARAGRCRDVPADRDPARQRRVRRHLLRRRDRRDAVRADRGRAHRRCGARRTGRRRRPDERPRRRPDPRAALLGRAVVPRDAARPAAARARPRGGGARRGAARVERRARGVGGARRAQSRGARDARRARPLAVGARAPARGRAAARPRSRRRPRRRRRRRARSPPRRRRPGRGAPGDRRAARRRAARARAARRARRRVLRAPRRPSRTARHRRAARADLRGAPGDLPDRPGGADERPPPQRRRPGRDRAALRRRRHDARRARLRAGRTGRARRRPAAGRGRAWRLRADGHARARGAARRSPVGRADARRLPRRALAAGVIRVLLADDQRVVREGLGTLLGLLEGIELVGTAADGEEAVALAGDLDPDVVLMDLRMPRVDGIEAIRRLAAHGNPPRTIALTPYAADASVLGALRAGARGYLTKDAGAEEIRAAVEAVARGEAALDPAVQHHVVAALSGPGAAAPDAGAAGPPGGESELPDGLTPREAEVLALIAAGLTNTEIAQRLVVSGATVKSHVNHIFAKAGVRDRAQAVVYAYEHGLTEPRAAGAA